MHTCKPQYVHKLIFIFSPRALNLCEHICVLVCAAAIELHSLNAYGAQKHFKFVTLCGSQLLLKQNPLIYSFY